MVQSRQGERIINIGCGNGPHHDPAQIANIPLTPIFRSFPFHLSFRPAIEVPRRTFRKTPHDTNVDKLLSTRAECLLFN
jgi:hypothetical protein